MRSSTVTRRTAHANRAEEKKEYDNVIVVDNLDPPRRRKKRPRHSLSFVGHLGANELFWLALVLSLISSVFLLAVFFVRYGYKRNSLVLVNLRPTLTVHGNGHISFPVPIDTSVSSDGRSESDEPDFGGLTISDSPHDEIQYGPDDKILESFHPEDDKTLRKRGSFDWYYYQFDDDENRNPMHGYHNKTTAKENHCRQVSWHRDMYPNCNEFHQLDAPKLALQDVVHYIGGGSYRNVFLLDDERNLDPDIVLKVAEMGLDYVSHLCAVMIVDKESRCDWQHLLHCDRTGSKRL